MCIHINAHSLIYIKGLWFCIDKDICQCTIWWSFTEWGPVQRKVVEILNYISQWRLSCIKQSLGVFELAENRAKRKKISITTLFLWTHSLHSYREGTHRLNLLFPASLLPSLHLLSPPVPPSLPSHTASSAAQSSFVVPRCASAGLGDNVSQDLV